MAPRACRAFAAAARPGLALSAAPMQQHVAAALAPPPAAPSWFPDVGEGSVHRSIVWPSGFPAIDTPVHAPAPPTSIVRSIIGDALELPNASELDETLQLMPKRTYQPNRLKRKRTHGFLKCAPALCSHTHRHLVRPPAPSPNACPPSQAHVHRFGPQGPAEAKEEGAVADRSHVSATARERLRIF